MLLKPEEAVETSSDEDSSSEEESDKDSDKDSDTVSIKEDNQSAICLTKNPQYHGRSKHISIKHHYIRDLVKDGSVVVQYCSTEDMVADIFTKGLSGERFVKLRQMLNVQDSLEETVFVN